MAQQLMQRKTFGAPIKSSQGRIAEGLYENFDKCMNKDMKMTYIGENRIQYNESPYIRDDGSIGVVTAEFDEGTTRLHWTRDEDQLPPAPAAEPKINWDSRTSRQENIESGMMFDHHINRDREREPAPAQPPLQVGTFEIPEIHREEFEGHGIELPSMAFEQSYRVEYVTGSGTAGTGTSVWCTGESTTWSDTYTTTTSTIAPDHTYVLNFGPCQYPEHTGTESCNSFRMNPCYSYCPDHMNRWYNNYGWESVTWTINQDGIAVASEDRSETLRMLSAEEIAKRDKIALENRKKAKLGELKATELLKSWLSEAEWNYLQEHNELELPSQYEKDTIYIVKRDRFKKVIKRVKGVDTEELCINTGGVYARDDNVLAQILMIKAQEEEFLKVAIKYPLVKK